MKELMKETEEKMKKSNARLAHEFTTIRAGRANPAVLDKVQVDYYGVPTPIQQMAAVSVSEARILVIQPWDVTSLKAIEKLKAKKKASELTEDEVKDGEKQVQDLTDKYVAEIDKMVTAKDQEIMSI